ncbi:ABC transporter ATP-binding protein [Candidatus Saccharibacteria bacterium]|nr:ABC transporter ATP-binding protein [Candidatus Saccharibacteria bacterium]
MMFISSAAYNLAGLLPPVATAGIIRMITENDFSGVIVYAGMFAAFYVIYFAFLRLNKYAYTKMAEYYHISLQERIFKNIDKHPKVLEKIPKGRAMDVFADDIRWMVDGMNVATEALIQSIKLIIIFIVFLTQDVAIGAIAIAVDLMYLLVLNGNAKEEAKCYANARKAEDKAISAFSEMVSEKEDTGKGSKKGFSRIADDERSERLGAVETSEQWAKMEKSFPGWKREFARKRKVIANRDTLWAALPYIGKILLYVLMAKMVIDQTMRVDVLILLAGYFEMTITTMDAMTVKLLDLSNYGVRVERIRQLLQKA